jgi:tetratricopeptide (TPR) repeat protein
MRSRASSLLLTLLVSSTGGFAQDFNYSPDVGGMTIGAQACADERRSPDERIRACTITLKDGGLRGRDLANIYINRARAERALHAYEDAARDLELAIKADDRYPVAYFERGNFLSDNGDNRRALESYDRAIQLKATYPEFFINRGNVHKDLGHSDAAIADYGKAVELDPKDVAAYSNRAGLYLAENQLDAAIADFDRMIALDPDKAEPYYSRGTARLKKGDADQALKDFAEALRLRPDFSAARAARGHTLQ